MVDPAICLNRSGDGIAQAEPGMKLAMIELHRLVEGIARLGDPVLGGVGHQHAVAVLFKTPCDGFADFAA